MTSKTGLVAADSPRLTSAGARPVRRWAPRFFAMTVIFTIAAACTSTGATEGGAACALGQTMQCETDAGCIGLQACLRNLTGFGPCVCAAEAGTVVVDAGGHD